MISTRLIHRLAFGIWAMSAQHAQAYMPRVHGLLFPGSNANDELIPQRKSWDREYTQDQVAMMNGITFIDEQGNPLDAFQRDIGPEVRNLVAVLPIKDVILKNDEYCGPIGMDTVAGWQQRYQNDPRVVATMLDVDSPGGEGTGMFLMTDQLMREGRKPCVSVVRAGMAASAGYGIVAATDKVFASRDTDEFGSIGTYVTLVDMKAYWAKEGLPIHEIYATESTEKNKDFIEALDGKYEALRKNFIDPFNEGFMSLVREQRPGLKEKDGVLNGRLFYAQDAKRLGLIDGFESLEGAAAAARALAGVKRTSVAMNTQQTSTTMKFKLFGKSTSALEAVAGKKADELTPELLGAADAELQAEGAQVFTVPVSESIKNASELMAAVDALEEAAKTATTNETNATDALAKEQAAHAVTTAAKTTAEGALAAANESLTAGGTALAAAIEKHGIVADAGQYPLDAVLAALDARTTELAAANEKVSTMEKESSNGHGPTGGVNKTGDNSGEPTASVSPMMKAAADELARKNGPLKKA